MVHFRPVVTGYGYPTHFPTPYGSCLFCGTDNKFAGTECYCSGNCEIVGCTNEAQYKFAYTESELGSPWVALFTCGQHFTHQQGNPQPCLTRSYRHGDFHKCQAHYYLRSCPTSWWMLDVGGEIGKVSICGDHLNHARIPLNYPKAGG